MTPLRERVALPSGTAAVAVGLAANGVLTYLFLALANRGLDDSGYSSLAVVWGLVSLLGAGLFQPLEQEISRATSERAARGLGSLPVVTKSLQIGASATLAAGLVVSATWRLGLAGILGNSIGLAVALLASLGAFMATEVARGLAAGRERFGSYGRSLVAEGLMRSSGAALLLVLGSGDVVLFGAVVALSFVAAAVGGVAGRRPFAVAGPPVVARELFPLLGLLLGMAVAEAFLLNIGPVAVAALSSSEADPGRFLNALVIARLPLLLFQAIKIALLPAHVALAARGQYFEMRRSTWRLVLLVGTFGFGSAVGAGLLGPTAVRLLFGDEVGHIDMFLLGSSCAAAMVAIVLSLTLLALGRPRSSVVAWLAGVTAFFVVLVAPFDPLLRVEVAMVAGFAVAASVMAHSARQLFSVAIGSIPDHEVAEG